MCFFFLFLFRENMPCTTASDDFFVYIIIYVK